MTDVEGSTPLWERDSRAMAAAMSRHDDLIEREITVAGGAVIKPRGEGDSRFCVFAAAPAAADGAVRIQRAISRAQWPTGAPIRVRIGIYSGQSQVRDPEYAEYYGTAPNRCARLRDLGHGGQILVSASAAALIASDLPERAELFHLGSYRLRGIDLPEPVHQLVHPDLQLEFPPLRGGRPGNLPTPLTAFVGREAEIADLSALVAGNRLLTLTGAAGVGKTRLAIELARAYAPDFQDGTWLCELASLREPGSVLRAVTDAFGLTDEAKRSTEEILTDYIRDRCLLVVLDNCEHLLGACASLSATVLQTSPRSSIIVTTREPLGVSGEVIRRVPSLAVPDNEMKIGELSTSESVALFYERAHASEPAFVLDEVSAPAVAQICRQLDGIPLAIELAAGRLDIYDVAEIASRVEDRFTLLTGGPRTGLERQQTMRAAVDWSYSLLSEEESVVFRRLAVFVDGFTLEAARAVCAGLDLLEPDGVISSLVRKSLVSRDLERAQRFRLLETLRAYATEKLIDAGEALQARQAHLTFFTDVAAQAFEPLEGGPEQGDWLDRLAADHDNLQAAVRFAVQTDPARGLRLVSAVAGYWDIRGHWDLGRQLTESLLAAAGDGATIESARALRSLGRLAQNVGEYHVANFRFEESLAIARELGDRRLEARVIDHLGIVARLLGDFMTARSHLEEALEIARDLGDRALRARILDHLGVVASVQEDATGARALHEESLELARALGNRGRASSALVNLGRLDAIAGDFEGARMRYEEALAIGRELDERNMIALAVGNLGVIARAQGDYETARARHEESLAIARELGDRSIVAQVVHNLGGIAHVQGDYEAARARYEDSLATARELGERRLVAWALGSLGGIACDQGDYEGARACYEESLTIARQLGEPEITAALLRGRAMLAEASGAHEAACVLAAAADAARERAGSRLDAFEQARSDETVARLREAMDPEAFDAAWARGRAMSLEEAVDLALEL